MTGFSLAEVLAAMAVFAIGLAGLGSMHITAIKLNARAHHTTRMAAVVHEHMEHLLTLPGTAPSLQDVMPALGQRTTYCVLYPPEGIRPCRDATFTSAYPAQGARPYCALTVQGPGSTDCAEASFPAPTVGYKVVWQVDIDTLGSADPQAIRLTHIDLSVSQTLEGTYAPRSAHGSTPTPQHQQYSLSVARFNR